MIWYCAFCVRPNLPAARMVSSDFTEIETAIEEAMLNDRTTFAAQNARVNAYTTRAFARAAQLSDLPGHRGCVAVALRAPFGAEEEAEEFGQQEDDDE